MASEIKVAIIGGGLGGLMAAICLEKAGIDYTVYERSPEKVPCLGAAIGISWSVSLMLQQLGLYEDIKKISCKLERSNIMDENLNPIGGMDYAYNEQRYGYGVYIMPRSQLFLLLQAKIPPSKIHYNKKLIAIDQFPTSQDPTSVTLRFADGTTTTTDLVIGADGAHSTTRRLIYKDLESRNLLPESDQQPLHLTASCLVGTTNTLTDPKFDRVKDSHAFMDVTLILEDQSPYRLTIFTVPGRKVSWMCVKTISEQVVRRTGEESPNSVLSRFSEWGSENASEMIEEVRDLKTSFGKGVTMNDFLKETDKKLVSKVVLEEKMFETWSSGRVVLLGDAAHKMSPAAGQGMAQCFKDCVSLSNQLNELTENSLPAITACFEAYKKERFDIANDAVNQSKQFALLFGGKSAKDNFIRKILLNYMPQWVTDRINHRLNSAKPQLTFLPFVPDLGVVKHEPVQRQSWRMAGTEPVSA